MIEIKDINFHLTKPYAAAAHKERSMVDDIKGCKWLGIYQDGVLAGFTCIMKRGSMARFRATYVRPEFRGKGLSKELNNATLAMAETDPSISSITAFVTTERNLAWYLKNGFKVQTQDDGIAYVRRVL